MPRRPARVPAVGWRGGEALDRCGDRVALDLQRGLHGGRRRTGGQGGVQPCIADLAELAEDLEVAVALGQHAAGLEQQLVEVAAQAHVVRLQPRLHRRVAGALVDAVLLVDVDGADLVFMTEAGDGFRGLVPVLGVAHQQRHVQACQLGLERDEVAQPEVHLGGASSCSSHCPGVIR